MKRQIWTNALAFSAVALLFVWGGCSSSDSPAGPGGGGTEQLAAPVAVTPTNRAADQPFQDLELKWRKVEPKNGDVVYDVYSGPAGGVMEVVENLPDTSLMLPGELRFDTEYEWRVVARDTASARTSHATFRFLVRSCHGVPGRVCNWAGTGSPGRGAEGQAPGKTQLYLPQDVCFDDAGNPYTIDWNNHRVLVVDADGNLDVLIGGVFGDAADSCVTTQPDGACLADGLGLNHPTHVSFDPSGRLILSAWHNSILKRMDPASGLIRTFCGDGSRSFFGDGGPAENATLDLPVNVIFDNSGNMYIGDQANMRVRRIDAITGDITTYAGSGTPRIRGFSGDGGPATSARLAFEAGQVANPSGKICLDPDDNLYIADTSNHCVRIVTTDGIINTFAGVGTVPGYDGDGGPATAAHLREPRDVAFYDGELYIADTRNNCIRKVDAAGVITTIAGVGGDSNAGSDTVDGKPAREAFFEWPFGVAIGPEGNVWITDTRNHRVRILYQ